MSPFTLEYDVASLLLGVKMTPLVEQTERRPRAERREKRCSVLITGWCKSTSVLLEGDAILRISGVDEAVEFVAGHARLALPALEVENLRRRRS